MPARLIGMDEKHVILLDKPIVLIGRHSECDVQVESRKVSRRHCCVAQVDDHLIVRDLESTNGIRVNGNPVLEGRLHNGDELTIGNVRYKVEWDQAELARLKKKRSSGRRRANRQAAPPAPISAANLLSCDVPIPIKEAAPARSSVDRADQGTERADARPPKESGRRTERSDASEKE